MSETIFKLVDELPANNVTVQVLRALDFVVPGEWKNLVGFEETIRVVTGETDQQMIQKIGERAIHLYNDRSQGYQRAIWLYQTVDRADNAMAAAALANKVGEKVGFLSFLNKITPKAEKLQFVDLSVKLVSELVAFCLINGLPGDSIGDFVKSLTRYRDEGLMRMAALICIDGLVPLGPDFVRATLEALEKLTPGELEQNETFRETRTLIPGGDAGGQLNFIQRSMDSVKDWMQGFVAERNLDPQRVIGSLKSYIDIADDKLDYLGAFLDMTTNYFQHTGTQTVARQLINRAVSEI